MNAGAVVGEPLGALLHTPLSPLIGAPSDATEGE